MHIKLYYQFYIFILYEQDISRYIYVLYMNHLIYEKNKKAHIEEYIFS